MKMFFNQSSLQAEKASSLSGHVLIEKRQGKTGHAPRTEVLGYCSGKKIPARVTVLDNLTGNLF